MKLERTVGENKKLGIFKLEVRYELGKTDVGKFECRNFSSLNIFSKSIGIFQHKWKLSYFKLSNFSIFPTALSNDMYPKILLHPLDYTIIAFYFSQ